MPRYKTARCVLQRQDHFLLAVHSSFFRRTPRRWGLLGGSIEWGEQPADAARRELREEIDLELGELQHVGAYDYKRRQHIVYAAETERTLFNYDEFELVEIDWFDLSGIEDLAARGRLHAGYELEAVKKAHHIHQELRRVS